MIPTLSQVDCTVEQNLCHQMGVSGYPTIRMYPRGSKGFCNFELDVFFDGIVAGANRYQPYPGNRRDVTSLHAWLQVTKTSILFGKVEILEPQFNVFFTTGTNTIGSGEHNSIHFQAQVLKQLLSQTSSLRSSVCSVPTLCGWWRSTLPGADIARNLLHIMNRWREGPFHNYIIYN